MTDMFKRAHAILSNKGTEAEATTGARRSATPLIAAMRTIVLVGGLSSLAACGGLPTVGGPSLGAPTLGQQMGGYVSNAIGPRASDLVGLPANPNHPTFQGSAMSAGQQRLLHALATVPIGTPIRYEDPSDRTKFETYTVVKQGKDSRGNECREFQGERGGHVRAGIVCQQRDGQLVLSQIEKVDPLVGNTRMASVTEEMETTGRKMG